MSGRVAADRLQVLQIYRLLQHVHQGDKAQIEKMVNLGVENLINIIDPRDGRAALHVAVLGNNYDMVSFLMSLGADPNIQDKNGCTPVMLAAELGNHVIVELLTQSNADLKLQDAEGKGVLFYCMYPTLRHSTCMQIVLNGQADANNVSADGIHLFQQMCEKAQECMPMCLALLDAGADPNATNKKSGVTALMGAARAGCLPLVKAILRKCGDPHSMDRKRFTATHYAAMGGYFEVIKSLSAYSADMGAVNIDDCTPLHYAAAAGDANCCKFLAQRGCNAKHKNQDGLLARLIAKEGGHKAAVKELKKAEKQHGKGHTSGIDGLTSELWALTIHDWSNEFEAELCEAFKDNPESIPTEEFVSVLKELKAPAEPRLVRNLSFLHDKDRSGTISIKDFIKGTRYVKKLFLLSSYLPKKKKGGKKGKGGKKKKKGKFVLPVPIGTLIPELMPRRDDGGPPHFMIEEYHKWSDFRRFDRDHPPEHPIANDSQWYIQKPEMSFVNINSSVRNVDLESLDLAFSQGVPVNVQDRFYKTPLSVACSTGNYEMAQYLLSNGADVTTSDQLFWTPLHQAAKAGPVELVQLLLEAGAAIDAQTLNGNTPLMIAIQSSQLSIVDLLIQAGADVTLMNKKEKDCLEIAGPFGDLRIIELIKAKLDTLPPPKEGAKGKGKPSKPSKKVSAAAGAVLSESLTTTAGKTSPKESGSIILQNARITAGKTNAVDVPFLPKTVLGKPPTTNQMMSKTDRRKEILSLEVDFDDFMTPFGNSTQTTTTTTALQRVKSHRIDRK